MAQHQQQAPETTFYIVGKNPTAEVLRLQENLPDVIVTGEVDDVKRSLSDSALMIAPMLFGTGIKTKIVEAMSWGVPVVTNPIGIEGINANHGEDCLSVIGRGDGTERAAFTEQRRDKR